MNPTRRRFLAGAASLALAARAARAADAGAESVTLSNAWVRATAPGQKVAGAYVDLVASAPMRLVGVSTPAAKRSEVHEMKHENGVMKMRALPDLALEPGQTVKLEPGAVHLMLFGLAKRLEAGQKIEITLEFQPKRGARFRKKIEAEVRPVEVSGDHAGHK